MTGPSPPRNLKLELFTMFYQFMAAQFLFLPTAEYQIRIQYSQLDSMQVKEKKTKAR
jgi:hypothetical protein